MRNFKKECVICHYKLYSAGTLSKVMYNIGADQPTAGTLPKISLFLFGTLHYNCVSLIGPRREKTCLRGFANNTGADQPAHLRSLISPFVIPFLESIICKLAAGEI